MPATKIITCFMLMVLSLRVNSLDNTNSEIAKVLHRPIRALTFPETSAMGIFFALAVPLEAPRNSVSMSYFFEASYTLPVNSTSFEPWIERKKRKRRGIDRTTIYQTVENKFERSGLKGRQCLLRAICETSEYPLQHNGVLGDIVQVIFTTEISLRSLILWCSMLLIVHGSRVKNVTSAVTRHIRSIGFPEGSGMGLFFAISIPVDIPNKAISVSFYFEANYMLPGDKNSSYYEEYFARRSFDRKLAYEIVENKLERAGYPGRVCLMRAICDVAKNPVTNNGLVGDVLHIFFTPSSSESENLSEEVRKAEYEKDCDERYGACPVNVLDLISYYI